MRRVETRVLRVDRDEHLHDVIFGQAIENDGRNRERLAAKAIDVGVQRQQPVLTVDRAQDAFALGHLQPAKHAAGFDWVECQLLVGRDDHGAGNRRQIACLPALLVVLHELVDLLPDDLALIGLVTRRDPPFEQVPIDLGLWRLLAATHTAGLVDVAEDLESNEFVDVAGGKGGLIELHAELLHPNSGDTDHRFRPEAVGFYRPSPAGSTVFAHFTLSHCISMTYDGYWVPDRRTSATDELDAGRCWR